jgi:hypothetical protein
MLNRMEMENTISFYDNYELEGREKPVIEKIILGEERMILTKRYQQLEKVYVILISYENMDSLCFEVKFKFKFLWFEMNVMI